MAEYGEVIKEFKRMCWFYSRDKMHESCPLSASYPNCNIGQCRKIAFEHPAEFGRKVMQWANEHPLPKYPSWEEYLCSIGFCSYNSLSESIPADIAQKLGIEPKETP